jgi:DNA-binding GntR family transcriptional regulator
LTPVGHVGVRTRASDRVYAELAAAIRDLRLPPGAALSETELAQQLQVSRTPLREAIARLVADGLMAVVPQVGTRVEPIRLRDVEEAQFVREHLELGAFSAACRRRERDVGRLRELLATQQRSHARRDVEAFFTADEALHEEIFRIGGYPGAWRLMQPVKFQLDRVRRLSLPEPATVRALITEHTDIVDALEAGDGRAGRSQLTRHVRRVLAYAPRIQSSHPQLFTA